MPRTIDDERRAALRVHLRTRRGVVTAGELTALGLPASYATAQVAAGRWQRAHRGTYVAHTGRLSFVERCAAAVAAAGHGAVVDGAAAATLHGLRGFDDGRVHLTLPHGASRRRLDGVVVRQSSVLTERSRRDRAGLPVVRPEWAALTVARHAPWQARAVFTAVVQQGLARPDHLAACVLAVGRFRMRPVVVEALRQVSGGTRSALEAAFLDAVHAAGLPPPVRNLPVVASGRRAWLDACWPEARLAVEIDGKAFHVLSEDWEDDLDRQNALVLAGLTVLRFTARAIDRAPGHVAEQVRRALAHASPVRASPARASPARASLAPVVA